MTSTRPTWTCPQCFKQSPSTHKRARVLVCPRCQALIDLKDERVIHKQVGYFPTQPHFVPGQTHTLDVHGKSQRWYVLGVLNYAEGEALWDEVFLINRSGDSAWVSVDEGEIYAHTPIDNPLHTGLLDHPNEIQGRTTINHQGVEFSRDAEGEAYIRGMSGAFHDELHLKDRVRYWEGYDPNEEDCLSVSWDAPVSSDEPDHDSKVTWYYGRWIDPAALRRSAKSSKSSSRYQSGSGDLHKIRLILAVLMALVGYLITFSDGNIIVVKDVPGSDYFNDRGEINYTSPPVYLYPERGVDFHFILPERVLPARMSARLTFVQAKGGPSPIELISADARLIKDVTPETLRVQKLKFYLARRGVVIKTRLKVPLNGKYTITFKGVSERNPLPTLSSMLIKTVTTTHATAATNTGTSTGTSTEMSSSMSAKTNVNANANTNISVPNSPSADELLTYIITTEAYKTFYLKIMLGILLLLGLSQRLCLGLLGWVFRILRVG